MVNTTPIYRWLDSVYFDVKIFMLEPTEDAIDESFIALEESNRQFSSRGRTEYYLLRRISLSYPILISLFSIIPFAKQLTCEYMHRLRLFISLVP